MSCSSPRSWIPLRVETLLATFEKYGEALSAATVRYGKIRAYQSVIAKMTIENAMLIVLPRSRAGPRPQTRLKKLRENAKPDPQYVRPCSQRTAGRQSSRLRGRRSGPRPRTQQEHNALRVAPQILLVQRVGWWRGRDLKPNGPSSMNGGDARLFEPTRRGPTCCPQLVVLVRTQECSGFLPSLGGIVEEAGQVARCFYSKT